MLIFIFLCIALLLNVMNTVMETTANKENTNVKPTLKIYLNVHLCVIIPMRRSLML